MTNRQTRRLSLLGALVLGLSLAACAQSEFTDEGAEQRDDLSGVQGGLAKSVLIAMGAIDDPHAAAAPKFQPRPPLVLPAQRTLPAPVDQDAMLASKDFPVDPEVRAERERAERLKGTASLNANAPRSTEGQLTLADQDRFKDLPTAGPGNGLPITNQDQFEKKSPLKPWDMDGKAQAAALDKAQSTGPRAKEQSLLAPPVDYRTPSDKAPLETPPTGIAAMKPSWWPF